MYSNNNNQQAYQGNKQSGYQGGYQGNKQQTGYRNQPPKQQQSYQKHQYQDEDYGCEEAKPSSTYTKFQSNKPAYNNNGPQRDYNNQGYNNSQQQQRPRYNNGAPQQNRNYQQEQPQAQRSQMNFHPAEENQTEGWGLGGQTKQQGYNQKPAQGGKRPQTGVPNFAAKPQASQQARNQQVQGVQPQRNKNPEIANNQHEDAEEKADPWSTAFKPANKDLSAGEGQTSVKPMPNKKAVGSYSSALVPVKSMKSVKIVSNQYKLSLGANFPVHLYRLDVLGLQFHDAALVQRVLRSKRKAMEAALGMNVCSGEGIYLLNELEEDARFSTSVNGTQYEIVIRADTHSAVNLQEQFTNEKNQTAQQLINVIIKTAFRDTKMKQIGKAPRFFDVDQPINCSANIMIWQGFKASAFQSQLGCTLVMDSIFKFMSTKTCLDRICELKTQYKETSQFKAAVDQEFTRNSVIANWGNKRTYYVDEIVWNKNPASQTFDYQGEDISMINYFKQNYKMDIHNPNQPLFAVKNAGSVLYLPPEFCLTDGVPAAMRNTREMRDAMAETRIKPETKMNKIKEMVTELFRQKAIADWGLKIEDRPIEMTTNVLAAPELIKGNQVIKCDENELRRLPIQKAVDLGFEEWVFIYDRQMYDLANNIIDSFKSSAKQLRIQVADPYFIETQQEKRFDEVEAELAHYMTADKKFRHPRIVVILLRDERNYTGYKELMQKFRMPSQVITRQNAFKFNLSKASNILRQINSKMGGDLYTLKFPQKMDNLRTMLIGLDVCHAGSKSVVGFSASINKEMSQYYSDYIVQSKGHEVVKDKLVERLSDAMECFAENHAREYPTNLVIYRDGVGDAQRDQVIEFEIQQFQEAIEQLYNKVAHKPLITVIFVNKRINQRFFMLDERTGKPMNPPSGCIIDRGLSQTTSVQGDNNEQSDKQFDFFMTPASANQGCVLPTHFFVTRNESTLTRVEIEQLTFALCHFYFNWAGPIKVPAPCQYAHKIADFFNTMGVSKRTLKTRCGQQHQSLEQVLHKTVRPLNEKLHFL